jgi:hypothetical protein
VLQSLPFVPTAEEQLLIAQTIRSRIRELR